MNIKLSVPNIILHKVQFSDLYVYHSVRGTPLGLAVDAEFQALNLKKQVKGTNEFLLTERLNNLLLSWEKQYVRFKKQEEIQGTEELTEQKNEELKQLINSLNSLLTHTLSVNDEINWDELKLHEAFNQTMTDFYDPSKAPKFVNHINNVPTNVNIIQQPIKPELENIRNEYGWFTKWFNEKKILQDCNDRLEVYQRKLNEVIKANRERKKVFKSCVEEHEAAKSNLKLAKDKFEAQLAEKHEQIDKAKQSYLSGSPESISDYCEMVLERSEYPVIFPKTWGLDYRAEARMVVINYDLPTPSQFPDTESFRFIKSRCEITEKKMTVSKQNALYDSVCYQVALRTLHELFEADAIDAIDSIVFNGVVTQVNGATGIEESKIILSVSAEKGEFLAFNLSQIDPKQTFKYLKGISAKVLSQVTAVNPIIQIDKDDKRFIESREIVEGVDVSTNLAAMHWDDFEHLVRELFEKEFSSSGGEVKVTQSSSDGGVDAIAFDPDPVRGGKIVIQAKRYTNTVGVSAVRDLYGTVLNEGANKGILVTTSDYGSDSYNFAKDKPITLMSGGNLLSLLEKHGHKATIDIKAAKALS